MASPASNASRPAEPAGAAGGASASGTRPAVDVTAITTRDDFLLELGESLAGQAAVRPVESLDSALEQLNNAKRGHVLVIDSRDTSDLRSEVDRAHRQAPHAVVLVFAPADAEKQTSSSLKGSNVFAVLPIPIDLRKTSAVFEGALADALGRKPARDAERNSGLSTERSSGVSVEPFASRTAPADPGDSGSRRKMSLWAAAALAVIAIAAVAFVFMGKNKQTVAPHSVSTANATAPTEHSTADATLAPAPVIETLVLKGTVDDLLEKARFAMRERRYSEPTGDNALLYYRSAVAADSTSAEALDGLQRIATVLASRFDEAMNGGRFDEAGLALANLKSATPNDPKLGALELRLTTAQILRALADGNVERATALIRVAQQSSAIPADQIAKWRAEITRRQEDSKIQKMATQIADHIRDGKLVEPADDSAKGIMQQLHEQAPTAVTAQRMQRELNSAYLRKAREAAIANHGSEADRWLAEAKAGGVTTIELAAYQHELTSARQKAAGAESERLAQLARERLKDGRLTDPAQDSASFYLGQIQNADATNPALASLGHDLAARLIDRARAAAQNGKSAAVDADLAQAKRLGADPKDILAVQQIESTARNPASGTGRAGGNPAALAANLKRLRYIPPEYPSKALEQNVAGSVTVEFVVDTSGNTRDVRIVESAPTGVFDKAAVTAVKRWRYQPGVTDDGPVEVPVRMSIRFELPPK